MENAYTINRTDQNEETRKIQYTGGSSYIVSLPKKWVQDLGLKQGDNVVILRQGNSLLQLAPASKRISKEQKEATIEIAKDNNNPYFLARKLISLYFLGYNIINVIPKDFGRLTGEQREVMKDVVKRVLMGTEIIADSAGGITLQVLINLLELSVDAAFKRMLLIAKSMHRDAILSLSENNLELAKEIVKSTRQGGGAPAALRAGRRRALRAGLADQGSHHGSPFGHEGPAGDPVAARSRADQDAVRARGARDRRRPRRDPRRRP